MTDINNYSLVTVVAFFFLLDMAVVNSYILYTLQNPDKRRHLLHEQFRVTLATDLHVAAHATASVDYGPRRQSLQPAARLTEWHFPVSLGWLASAVRLLGLQ